MIEKISNFKQVEAATVRISCGDHSGTAFFVESDEQELLLLTVDHLLADSDSQPILIEIDGQPAMPVTVLLRIADHDVALVKPGSALPEISALPLLSDQVAYNSSWETFGYMMERVNSGGKLNGTISRTNEGTKWDIDLHCEQYTNYNKFEGLSGAPLIVNGFVAGIIGYDLAGTLGATSIGSIMEKLHDQGVGTFTRQTSDIPDSLEQEIAELAPNAEAMELINQTIKEQASSSFFLVTGNPGCGKTTIAAQLKLEDEKNVICDRYFIKVPEEDKVPTQIRATPDFFKNWLEEVYWRVLYNQPPAKSTGQPNEKILAVHHGLQKMAKEYEKLGKIGFLVVDGLDDIRPEHMLDFFSFLPSKLPANLKFIFCCTSKNILPANWRNLFGSQVVIKVGPLSPQATKSYLREHLEQKKLTADQLTNLADKSEGHPLYLRYLVKLIEQLPESTNLDELIDNIPLIEGEIGKYYQALWDQISDNTDQTWLTATLAHLRLPILKDVLFDLLPGSDKAALIPAFQKIQHLLKENQQISVYHTSFSDFIKTKTALLSADIHTNIANYCLNAQPSYFSISEKIHHLAFGKQEAKTQSLSLCNQSWIDDCAVYSVIPDIVLADIRKVTSLSAEAGIASKVIELLLLSQRVYFRYNILFDENATYLVNALLEIGKADEAIRYIVRNKTLMVPDGDALYFLQRFYEYDANEEAEELLSAINRLCASLVEKDLNSEIFNRYINLKFSAVTLSSNKDYEEAYHEFDHIKKIALKIIKQGNTPETVHHFKDQIGSFNVGYLMWRFNIPPVTGDVEEQKLHQFTSQSSGYIAQSILEALNFEEKSPFTGGNQHLKSWIVDLERMIDQFGIHADYYSMALRVMLSRSKRTDLVEKIILDQFKEPLKLDIRQDNQVDFDAKGTSLFTLYAQCMGYKDQTDTYPRIFKPTQHNWEKAIGNIIEYIAFFSGKVERLIAEGKNAQLPKMESKLSALFAVLIPDLNERIDFDRSYALPENIYPIIHQKIILLLIDHFPGLIPGYIAIITDQKKYQLGLYTEGYIDSLFIVTRNLAKRGSQELNAHQVAGILERHVLLTAENRWERNEYLLRLVEIYGRMDNHDKAGELFNEMIKTSMGPSWYKEAQLGIINSAVSHALPQNGDATHLQRLAAHLHHASGEMTFQRYVKQQQQEFVGDLAGAGFLEKAIAYFKYLLLPDDSTVITNAESGLVDMPSPGIGYVLGAKAIEEQSATLELLSSIDCSDSLAAWGLIELFMPGDERYLSDFTALQASILGRTEQADPELFPKLLQRLAKFVIAEVDFKHRSQYVKALKKELTQAIWNRLKDELLVFGLKVGDHLKPQEEDDEIPVAERAGPLDKLDKLDKLRDQALLKIQANNISAARKIILEGLQNIQEEKYSVWDGFYSNKITQLRDLLKDVYQNSDEFIKAVQHLIVNEPYNQPWITADQLLMILRKMCSESEKEKILSAVDEHVYQMVRTPQSEVDKYDWMAQIEPSNRTTDEILTSFLIWFLNHPALQIKNRTIEILSWLSRTIPGKLIPKLVEETLSNHSQISCELAAAVLHQIAAADPVLFWNTFKVCLEKDHKEILNIQHVMIKSSYLDCLNIIHSHGINDAESWIERFKLSFPTRPKENKEIFMDQGFLFPIDDYLTTLNNHGILSKSFCGDLLSSIAEEMPYGPEVCEKASNYITRSFNNYNDIIIVASYESKLRYCLNTSLIKYVTWEDLPTVASILRFYHPTFPENDLVVQVPDFRHLKKVTADLINNKTQDVSAFFQENDLFIDFYMEHNSKKGADVYPLSISSFLIPASENLNDLRFPESPVYSENGYPVDMQGVGDEESIPLSIDGELSGSIPGGSLLPSFPISPNLTHIYAGQERDIKRTYWRYGRNWDQVNLGLPLHTGYCTTAPVKDIIKNNLKHRMIWKVSLGYDHLFIDVQERKLIRFNN